MNGRILFLLFKYILLDPPIYAQSKYIQINSIKPKWV